MFAAVRTVRIPVLAAGLTVLLAGCAAASSSGSSASSPPKSSQAKPSSTAAAAPETGPLGVLPLPAGAKPWKENTSAVLGLKDFVHSEYVQSAWSKETGLYTQRGFSGGTIQGWFDSDGSQERIAIARFSSDKGAVSLFDGLTATALKSSDTITKLTDPADGGLGVIDSTPDSDGDTYVDLFAHVNGYVIDAERWTAAKPDPAGTKALLRRQYEAIKKTGA